MNFDIHSIKTFHLTFLRNQKYTLASDGYQNTHIYSKKRKEREIGKDKIKERERERDKESKIKRERNRRKKEYRDRKIEGER